MARSFALTRCLVLAYAAVCALGRAGGDTIDTGAQLPIPCAAASRSSPGWQSGRPTLYIKARLACVVHHQARPGHGRVMLRGPPGLCGAGPPACVAAQ